MMTKRRAPTRTDLGDLLSAERKRSGWTQEQLAAITGLSQETISGIERGITPTPQIPTLRALADAFQRDMADFFIAARLADTRSGAQRIEERARAIAEPRPPYDDALFNEIAALPEIHRAAVRRFLARLRAESADIQRPTSPDRAMKRAIVDNGTR